MIPQRACCALLVLASLPAVAQMWNDSAPPQHRLVHKNTLAFRVNPLGLLYDGRFSYRLRLYESESKVLRDNFIGVGVAPTMSPAFLRIGPYVEFNPTTIFGLWSTVQFVQYFGSFNLLQSFPGAQSDFRDSQISARSDLRQLSNGFEVTIGANLVLKLGPVVLRSLARLVYADLNLREGDRVYYDQFYDTLSPNRGWMLTNDVDLLAQLFDNRLIAGARYTMTFPLYDAARHLDPTDPVQEVNNSMHRVGPFLGWTFFSEDGAGFNNPTVFLLVQWWAQHRFRTTELPALPLMGVGFQFTGDFVDIK